MLNWMNRYSLTGGIFGRPLVVANFANCASSALMLIHLARRDGVSTALAIALGVYALMALAFGAKLFVQGSWIDAGRGVQVDLHRWIGWHFQAAATLER
ncbi:MAG TPA: hypothetical protein VF618_03130 [Thermoanaerobaculia bacterium]